MDLDLDLNLHPPIQGTQQVLKTQHNLLNLQIVFVTGLWGVENAFFFQTCFQPPLRCGGGRKRIFFSDLFSAPSRWAVEKVSKTGFGAKNKRGSKTHFFFRLVFSPHCAAEGVENAFFFKACFRPPLRL